MRSLPVRILGVVEAATALALLGWILGYLGSFFWFFELFCHFRLQIAVFLLPACLIFIWFRRAVWIGMTGLALMVLLYDISGYWMPPPRAQIDEKSSTPLSLITYNIQTRNDNYQEVLDYLREKDADIVCVQEVDSRRARQLGKLSTTYPFKIGEPRRDNCGIILLSKIPWEHAEIIYEGGAGLPSVAAVFSGAGKSSLLVLGTHPLPPIGARNANLRNRHLHGIGEFIKKHPATHKILIGDLNLTPFSPYFGQLLKQTELRDASRGFGLKPTWLRNIPWFAIPIDHVLISDNIDVKSHAVDPSMGSDHHPVRVDLVR